MNIINNDLNLIVVINCNLYIILYNGLYFCNFLLALEFLVQAFRILVLQTRVDIFLILSNLFILLCSKFNLKVEDTRKEYLESLSESEYTCKGYLVVACKLFEQSVILALEFSYE